MGNGSGVSRGDRNRNARLEKLRGLVPVSNAIVGIDLADSKQMVVVTDHDLKVLARKTFPLPRLGSGCCVGLGRRTRGRARSDAAGRTRVGERSGPVSLRTRLRRIVRRGNTANVA